jgi:hypothetical protein
MQRTELTEQIAVVEWCDLLHIPIIHIPNEGKRSVAYGANLRRAGLRSGVPDLFLPLARNGRHGLFIELKNGKGRTSEAQREWLGRLNDLGYRAVVCYGADAAIAEIKSYIGGNK